MALLYMLFWLCASLSYILKNGTAPMRPKCGLFLGCLHLPSLNSKTKTVVICHSLLLMSYIMSSKDNKSDMVPYVTHL